MTPPREDVAWAEHVFLVVSPLWMLLVALVVATGWIHALRDVGYLVVGLGAMAPFLIAPAVLHHRQGRPERWGASHWFQFNLWVAIVVFFGTYVGTHYFFDLMGMEYRFPVEWTVSARVVGRTGGDIPIFMFPLTHAYFATYFVVLTIAWRRLRARLPSRGPWAFLALVAMAYGVAYLETAVMANEALDEFFRYADRARMLRLGSLGYAVYFVIGVPMLAALERHPQTCPGRVATNALATCAAILFALELWGHVVGPI